MSESSISVSNLSLVIGQPGCSGPYLVDSRPNRESELVIFAEAAFSAPSPDVLAWAAPNGTCICQTQADEWNARVSSLGLNSSCATVCQMERFVRVSKALDTIVPALHASVPFVTTWYFGYGPVQYALWMPPSWSLASANTTVRLIRFHTFHQADEITF